MNSFKNGQRVIVKLAQNHKAKTGEESTEIEVNAPGTVRRLRISDNGAWVALDARCQDDRVHPFETTDLRATHVMTYPEHCEAVLGDLSG